MMITYSVWRAGAKDETGSRWGGGGGGRVFKCLAFHLNTNIEHWISPCLSVQILAGPLQFSLDIEHFVLLICLAFHVRYLNFYLSHINSKHCFASYFEH